MWYLWRSDSYWRNHKTLGKISKKSTDHNKGKTYRVIELRQHEQGGYMLALHMWVN